MDPSSRRGLSIGRAELERLVRNIAEEAAQSSEAWRRKTDGGKRVTSHDLRSVFMNRIDPNDAASAPVRPGGAPFHPNDRCDEAGGGEVVGWIRGLGGEI